MDVSSTPEPPYIPEKQHTDAIKDRGQMLQALARLYVMVYQRAATDENGDGLAIPDEAVGIVVSHRKSGVITEANDAFLKMTGYSKSDIQAQKLVWTDLIQLEVPESLWRLEVERVRQQGIALPIKVRLTTQDKALLDVFLGSIALSAGSDDMMTFVVETRMAGSSAISLANEENLLKMVADTAPVMIWMTDEVGNTVYVNDSWGAYAGIAAGESFGDWWVSAIRPRERESVHSRWQEIVRGQETFKMETRMRMRDGTYHWFEVKGAPRYGPLHQFLGHMGTCMDITERKQTRDELLRSMEVGRLLRRFELFCLENQEMSDILSYAANELGSFLKSDRCAILTFGHADGRFFLYRMAEYLAVPNVKPVVDTDPHYRLVQDLLPRVSQAFHHPVSIVATDKTMFMEKFAQVMSLAGLDLADYDDILHKFWDLNSIQSFVGTEIRYRNLPYGWLVVHQCDYPRKWRDYEVELLEEMATKLGEVVYQAVLEIQRVEAEREAENAKIATHMLMNNILDYAIMMLDPAGMVVNWNEGAERLLGYTADEVIGKHFSMFYPDREVWFGKPGQALSEAAERGRFDGEDWLIRKDGSKFWANCIINPLFNDKGELLGFSKLVRDVSDRRAMEAKIQEAQEMAQDARRRSMFFSVMSHELRTPLNAIAGFAELMEGGGVGEMNDRQRRYVHNIYLSSQHLLDMVNDILDLTKIEAGRLELQPEVIPLESFMFELKSIVEDLADKKRHNISFEIDPALTTIVADPVRLRQIFFNLLSNAVKFTPEGGKIWVKVNLTEDKLHVHFSVSDTGIGIPKEKQSMLFQNFFQVESKYSSQQPGTGLGLALTQRLVALHGGTLGVESVEGKGSSFYFTLPLAQPQKSTVGLPSEKG